MRRRGRSAGAWSARCSGAGRAAFAPRRDAARRAHREQSLGQFRRPAVADRSVRRRGHHRGDAELAARAPGGRRAARRRWSTREGTSRRRLLPRPPANSTSSPRTTRGSPTCAARSTRTCARSSSASASRSAAAATSSASSARSAAGAEARAARPVRRRRVEDGQLPDVCTSRCAKPTTSTPRSGAGGWRRRCAAPDEGSVRSAARHDPRARHAPAAVPREHPARTT